MKTLKLTIIAILMMAFVGETMAYPWDGFSMTAIRRLVRLQLIMEGIIKDTKPVPGAQKTLEEIQLNLMNAKGDSLDVFTAFNPALQKSINSLFPNMDESYSLCVLDITPGKPLRYAYRQEKRGFMPGSVAKLAVLAGLFSELEKLHPDSFEKRQELMKNRMVRAGKWANFDEHTIPVYNITTQKLVKKVVQENDTCSLYEWADHMVSVSNNAAASIVWKEAILMRAYGANYPPSAEQEAMFFRDTPKSQLRDLAIAVVNEPLRNMGITTEEFRLGSMFTRDAKAMVPGAGGTIASPYGMMKYLVAMERGKIVDSTSSLEIKRLMYSTDRRIRYAASTALNNAAVYYKSGSLYKCIVEEGFSCKKYMGNVDNYMNSVVVVEQPDGSIYMVTLMSNVLRKNSANDHFALASQIDKIVRK
ncbi:MAG: hypothetical protein HQ521_07910 [Bacteroidetes bacterium]|nr:hypothetical protein [Bacteroidota bacterium]